MGESLSTRGTLIAVGSFAIVASVCITHVALDQPASADALDTDLTVLRYAPTSDVSIDTPAFALPATSTPVEPLVTPTDFSGSVYGYGGRDVWESGDGPRGPVLLVRATLDDGHPAESALDEMLAEDVMLAAIATREPPPASFEKRFNRNQYSYGIGRTKRIGETGRANLGQDALAHLELDGPGTAWVSLLLNNTVIDQREVDGIDQEVAFVVTKEMLAAIMGAVKVRVVDSQTHAPIVGARVTLSPTLGGTPQLAVKRNTDRSGLIEVEQHLPGKVGLIVRAEGFLPGYYELVVPPGGSAGATDVPLHRTMLIEGRVVDRHGNPMPSIVTCYRIDDDTRSTGRLSIDSLVSGRTAPADDEARFRFATVAPGEYVLRVTPRTWRGPRPAAAPVIVDTRRGHVRDLLVTALPGTPVTLEPSWSDGVEFEVHLLDDDGLPVNTPHELIGGMIRKLFLLPGTYEMALSDDDGELFSHRSFVVEHEPLTLRVDV